MIIDQTNPWDIWLEGLVQMKSSIGQTNPKVVLIANSNTSYLLDSPSKFYAISGSKDTFEFRNNTANPINFAVASPDIGVDYKNAFILTAGKATGSLKLGSSGYFNLSNTAGLSATLGISNFGNLNTKIDFTTTVNAKDNSRATLYVYNNQKLNFNFGGDASSVLYMYNYSFAKIGFKRILDKKWKANSNVLKLDLRGKSSAQFDFDGVGVALTAVVSLYDSATIVSDIKVDTNVNLTINDHNSTTENIDVTGGILYLNSDNYVTSKSREKEPSSRITIDSGQVVLAQTNTSFVSVTVPKAGASSDRPALTDELRGNSVLGLNLIQAYANISLYEKARITATIAETGSRNKNRIEDRSGGSKIFVHDNAKLDYIPNSASLITGSKSVSSNICIGYSVIKDQSQHNYATSFTRAIVNINYIAAINSNGLTVLPNIYVKYQDVDYQVSLGKHAANDAINVFKVTEDMGSATVSIAGPSSLQINLANVGEGQHAVLSRLTSPLSI